MLNTAEKLFESNLSFISIDLNSVDEAKQKFLEFQKEKIIKEVSSFEDMVWYTTDQYDNVGFYFKLNEFSYSLYEKVLDISFEDFINYEKTFVISLLRKKALKTIENFLLDIKHIIDIPPLNLKESVDTISLYSPAICQDFFSLIPSKDVEEIDSLLDTLDDFLDHNFYKNSRSQRELANIDSYLCFDDIITDFWNNNQDIFLKLFFYPLYLWWKLTACFPLRPREFILTPRTGFKKGNGEYYLSIRRNQLKGGNNNFSYKIDSDYALETYKLSEKLGKSIEEYISLTKEYESNELDTLFIVDIHYQRWGRKKPIDSRYFTYRNLTTLLRYFYKEIVIEKYGYRLVESGKKHLEEGEIEMIHLGDTRHISLINLIREGGTPYIAKLLAGHSFDNMAAHYYSNVKKFVECKTYRQLKKIETDGNFYSLKLPHHNTGEEYIIVDQGKCFSSKTIKGCFDDCVKSLGPNGEIGYCPDCGYFNRDLSASFLSENIFTRHLKEDCDQLAYAIKMARQGKGCEEDIAQALLRLSSSSLSYENFLKEKRNMEE